jgi:thymidylate kinase
MATPTKFLIEGLDRLGKDTLIQGILHRLGYHEVLHYRKPQALEFYRATTPAAALRSYQEASFRTMLCLLRDAVAARIICNRAHIGECVYAPIYRGYEGEYVFDLEREFGACNLDCVRLILLTEDFESSAHFVDDGKSLGESNRRRDEQQLFLHAYNRSAFKDKRIICVTDRHTGAFRPASEILAEALV